MRFRLLGAGLAVLCFVGVSEARAEQGRDQAELTKRGEYLVSSVGMCADCHTPKDDQGKPDESKKLQGTLLSIRPKEETTNWAARSPDITGAGLVGKWGEEAMVEFLMTGGDSEGKSARPPMPQFRLNEQDARAVTAYLKSLGGSK